MTRTKSSRALVSVVLAVLMAVAFMPAISYTSFAATAKKATKVTKVYHKANTTYTRTVGSAWTLKYKLSPSKLTTAAKKVVWKSSNKSVVSVSAKSGNKAAVSFKKAGTATVTVYTKANKKAKATWKFKVVKPADKTTTLTGVTVSAPNVKDAVSDKVAVGTTLKANVAPEDAAGVTYQWYADGTPIAGATKASFTVTTDQIGKAISVKAKSKNEVESAKTATVSDITVDKFYIDGTPNVDETLKVKAAQAKTQDKTQDKTFADLAYDVDQLATVEWHRVTTGSNGNSNKTDVVVGTGASYKVAAADKGSTLYAVVTPNKDVKVATTMPGGVTVKDGKYTLPETNKVGGAITNVSTVLMKAEGKALDGETEVKAGTVLSTEVTPAAAASALDYQWYKDGYKIDGATSSTYTPSEAGTYTVKVTVKKDNLVYTANGTHYVGSAKVAPAYKEFTGVKLVNVDATNGKRTTNLAGDKYAVDVPGLKVGTDFNVTWYKEHKDDYGKLTTPINIGTGQIINFSGNNAPTSGEKIYAVVTGTGAYKGYETTTATITIDSTASAKTDIGDLTLNKTASTKSVELTGFTDPTKKVVWQKAPVSAIGLTTEFTDTTTTGNIYELSTTEQTGGFQLRAKILNADGTVYGYSKWTATIASDATGLTMQKAQTVIK